MEITGILITAGVIGGVGILVGILLGRAGKVFHVEENETEKLVREALPGNNCGACGYPGCDGMARAIAAGEAPTNGCPVGGAPVAEKIGQIMGGGSEGPAEVRVAFVHCRGDCDRTGNAYNYVGPEVCTIAGNTPNGGPKKCRYGCLGYGECVSVCEFGAISLQNGIAVVDPEKCVACGMCVKACPRRIISLVPKDKDHHIACSSKDRGLDVKKICSIGCLGCTMCVKKCPEGAIEMQGNLPVIDYSKCVNCGACASGCPAKSISSGN